MTPPSPHLYRDRALALGRDPATIDRALEIAAAVSARGADPVFTLNHLAQLTGTSWEYLRDVVARRRDPYLSISRPKQNGKTRAISSPEPVLMDVQRWILKHVLSACDIHQSSYAYQRDRSIRKCAEEHLNSRWLVKMDIHDFFGSVGERSVYSVFLYLGYPRLLSFEMARLCTRSREFNRVFDDAEEGRSTPYRLGAEGRLPQGAPTSGALANAVMFDTDAELDSLARNGALVYTRYSDDLVFSAGGDFSRERAVDLVRCVATILERNGFSPHRAKTRVVPPGARHVVLGLLLAEGRVRLLPEFKRRIEVHIRGVAKWGVVAHAGERHFSSVFALINHVDGCIAFAESIDPSFASGARDSWSTALAASGFPIDF